MKPPKTAIYAVKAMIYLAERRRTKGRPMIPCHQIAAAGDMPERFLLQILRSLAGAGLLQSSRGIEGASVWSAVLATFRFWRSSRRWKGRRISGRRCARTSRAKVKNVRWLGSKRPAAN